MMTKELVFKQNPDNFKNFVPIHSGPWTENYGWNMQTAWKRRTSLTKADVETYLSDYIGAAKVIWLNGDIPLR